MKFANNCLRQKVMRASPFIMRPWRFIVTKTVFTLRIGVLSMLTENCMSTLYGQVKNRWYCLRESRGLNPAWLEQQSLRMHLRKGGERLKLAENRSTRDMKSHYQALRVPFWLRQQLPFISIGDQLLFAAGVGMQSKYCDDAGSGRIVFEWVAD